MKSLTELSFSQLRDSLAGQALEDLGSGTKIEKACPNPNSDL
jgi:hypothetical protein